jgi:hypothetical protein
VSISDIANQGVSVSGKQEIEITDLRQNIQYSPTALIADTEKLQSTIDWRARTSLKDGMLRMWNSYGER